MNETADRKLAFSLPESDERWPLPASPGLFSAETLPRDKEKVQAAFGRAAATYDRFDDVQAEVALRLADHLPLRAADILEIGCGTGRWTAQLRDRYPQARLVAVDFAPAMLEVARQKFAPDPALDWLVADGETYTPVDGRTFDLITSSSAFQWFTNLPAALARYAALSAPGGQLAFAVFGPETLHEWRAVATAASPGLADFPTSGFYDRERLARALAEHWSAARIEEARLTRTYPSMLALLRQIKYTGTHGGRWQGFLTPALLRRWEARYREVHSELRATYQIFFVTASRDLLP